MKKIKYRKDDPRSVTHEQLCLIVKTLEEKVSGLNNRVLELEKLSTLNPKGESK